MRKPALMNPMLPGCRWDRVAGLSSLGIKVSVGKANALPATHLISDGPAPMVTNLALQASAPRNGPDLSGPTTEKKIRAADLQSTAEIAETSTSRLNLQNFAPGIDGILQTFRRRPPLFPVTALRQWRDLP